MKKLTSGEIIVISDCYQATIKYCGIYKVNPQKVLFGSTLDNYINLQRIKIVILGNVPENTPLFESAVFNI